ncbi:hypothetical protein C0J52_24503 [Blattella germanica]|nr:hypothetical protein C0J52_24503 [Blattella germanica]
MANKHGRTLLFFAALNGHTKDVELLLEHKAIVLNMMDKHGLTPLHAAALNGHCQIVQLLLKNKCKNNKYWSKENCHRIHEIPLHEEQLEVWYTLFICMNSAYRIVAYTIYLYEDKKIVNKNKAINKAVTDTKEL